MTRTISPLPSIDFHNGKATLHGAWRVGSLALPGVMKKLNTEFRSLPAPGAIEWDLSKISTLDHIGAQLLWNAWGRARPMRTMMARGQDEIFARLAEAGPPQPLPPPEQRWFSYQQWQKSVVLVVDHVTDFLTLLGQFALDLMRFASAPAKGPWREISANVYRAGYQALGITALVGFLIGIVLSYLSAQQLQTFGADIYLVNILGMSIIRELGPMLAAILVAGRSGSSITAQIGVMRVTEELDAMLVMGLPHGFRLIMPRVLALAIAMPLLVIWTDAMALFGGMVAAYIELNMPIPYFVHALPDAVPLANYYIGIGKGVVFGCLIALVSCHFGLRIRPDTESLGKGTTTSVVSSITIVILADAVFAIVFRGVGF
jgi:phospholipid/cholesterol/gamma-HCH transport system permease protein